MSRVNLQDARVRLDELVDCAEAGDTVVIIRNGQPVARLVGWDDGGDPEASGHEERGRRPGKGIDVNRLRALTARMPLQPEEAGDFVRRMRDEDRF